MFKFFVSQISGRESFFHRIDEEDRVIYICEHKPKKKERIIIFLDSVLDEKERAGLFSDKLAANLKAKNNLVVHPDYYGAGESQGGSEEFSIELSVYHTIRLIKLYKKKYKDLKLILCGFRVGADLALEVTKHFRVDGLILIDPIIDGSRFFLEIEMRRKVFHKLNKSEINYTTAESNLYEDFEGFLISKQTIERLKKINSLDIDLEKQNILMGKPLISSYNNLQKQFVLKNSGQSNLSVFDFPGSIFDNQLNINELTNVIENFYLHD